MHGFVDCRAGLSDLVVKDLELIFGSRLAGGDVKGVPGLIGQTVDGAFVALVDGELAGGRAGGVFDVEFQFVLEADGQFAAVYLRLGVDAVTGDVDGFAEFLADLAAIVGREGEALVRQSRTGIFDRVLQVTDVRRVLQRSAAGGGEVCAIQAALHVDNLIAAVVQSCAGQTDRIGRAGRADGQTIVIEVGTADGQAAGCRQVQFLHQLNFQLTADVVHADVAVGQRAGGSADDVERIVQFLLDDFARVALAVVAGVLHAVVHCRDLMVALFIRVVDAGHLGGIQVLRRIKAGGAGIDADVSVGVLAVGALRAGQADLAFRSVRAVLGINGDAVFAVFALNADPVLAVDHDGLTVFAVDTDRTVFAVGPSLAQYEIVFDVDLVRIGSRAFAFDSRIMAVFQDRLAGCDLSFHLADVDRVGVGRTLGDAVNLQAAHVHVCLGDFGATGDRQTVVVDHGRAHGHAAGRAQIQVFRQTHFQVVGTVRYHADVVVIRQLGCVGDPANDVHLPIQLFLDHGAAVGAVLHAVVQRRHFVGHMVFIFVDDAGQVRAGRAVHSGSSVLHVDVGGSAVLAGHADVSVHAVLPRGAFGRDGHAVFAVGSGHSDFAVLAVFADGHAVGFQVFVQQDVDDGVAGSVLSELRLDVLTGVLVVGFGACALDLHGAAQFVRYFSAAVGAEFQAFIRDTGSYVKQLAAVDRVLRIGIHRAVGDIDDLVTAVVQSRCGKRHRFCGTCRARFYGDSAYSVCRGGDSIRHRTAVGGHRILFSAGGHRLDFGQTENILGQLDIDRIGSRCRVHADIVVAQLSGRRAALERHCLIGRPFDHVDILRGSRPDR